MVKRLEFLPFFPIHLYLFKKIGSGTKDKKTKNPGFHRDFLNGQLQLISLQTATKLYHRFASDVFRDLHPEFTL